VAVPTTSLPEVIGGVRNWDYRYCWLRDTTLALYALAITGYGGEARRFSQYLPRVCAATAPDDLRIMYGIDGETDLEEKALDHLDGYEGSRPVRVGNSAYKQRQIDVYGEILDWALLFETLGGKFDGGGRAMLAALANYVTDHWHEPDQSLWEMRTPPLHHVHGKIMSWVALDRAIRLFGKNHRWERERDRIVAEVNSRGGVRKCGHLIQAYERPRPDAALLLTPMTAFPVDDSILRNTVAAVEKELRRGEFVYRYRTENGIKGDEGAFLICSFWLVDAFFASAGIMRLRSRFERLLGGATTLGCIPRRSTQAAELFSAISPRRTPIWLSSAALLTCSFTRSVAPRHCKAVMPNGPS
jgi:GH15 family glucan-1,4-alpha-glucosidase